MTWSLLNVTMAEKVEALLTDPAIREDAPDLVRAMDKGTALSVIHAVLWAYSSRSGSFASCYAYDALYNALGLETWTFKKPTDETEAKS